MMMYITVQYAERGIISLSKLKISKIEEKTAANPEIRCGVNKPVK